MTIQSNLKEVFDILNEKGVIIELGDSYCSGTHRDSPIKTKKGWVCSTTQDDDRLMEDINGEGTAEVTWTFGPPVKVEIIAEWLVNAFTKKGYIVEWDKSMGNQITAVIEIDDLPRSFLQTWSGNNLFIDDEIIEERVNPDDEVVFNEDDEDRTIFSTDEEDDDNDNEEDDYEPVVDPSDNEEESTDEDETLCMVGCKCVNCKDTGMRV